jgi:biopolymer transport protein ExbD
MAFHIKSGGKSYQSHLDLNITPMVDVMLVLLIIFIITAPLIKPQEIKVDLPKTAGVTKQSEQKNVQLILSASGGMTIEGRSITDAQLITALIEGVNNPSFHLEIQADATVPYKYVAHIMGLAQKYGVKNLSFVTNEK